MFVITLTRDHINVLQQFLLSNKLETAMWLSRLFTVYCSIMFILPLCNNLPFQNTSVLKLCMHIHDPN
uniref:Uncharacterized protein n=1 Tax=Sinocyclocheilus anshuiensis TaxID=1608454 RepID=A0A671MLC0_9TELE